MTALRGILLAHLLLFAGWGGYLLQNFSRAATVWLATEPVDPRDWISGQYVALRYALGQPAAAGCKELLSATDSGNASVFVRLVEGEATAEIAGRPPVTLWEATECQRQKPTVGNHGLWLRGAPVRWGSAWRLNFGIERFYAGEKSKLLKLRSGQVVAEVAVNHRGRARVLKLHPLRKDR